jgi:DNA-binding MarR family transcriptional regulator
MPDASSIDDADLQVWRSFLMMRKQLDRALEQRLQEDAGISGADFEVLMTLNSAQERQLRARDLTELLGWEKSRVSHQVTRMAARGFVERQECSGDRRASYIHLTGEGRRVVVRALPGHTATIRRLLFVDLTSEQQAEFLAISQRMNAAIEAEPGATVS